MIKINRRLKLIAAINYCEKHHIVYQVAWNPLEQYRLAVPYSEHEQEINHFLDEWERSQ